MLEEYAIKEKVRKDVKLDFCDVLIEPIPTSLSSRKQVDLNSSLNFRQAGFQVNPCVPVCASNMEGVGNLAMSEKMASRNMLTCLTKSLTHRIIKGEIEGFKRNQLVCGTIGLDDVSNIIINEYDLKNYFDILHLDVANGYMDAFVDFVKRVRFLFPKIGIIAGNVVTSEGAWRLSEAGADAVKVGIGSGSVCTTRRVAGVGYPQLSAVMECKEEMGRYAMIVSDGGCVHPGDVAKAIGAGADIVMLGGMLAGHDEGASDGLMVDDGEKIRYVFFGSSSSKALEMNKNSSKHRTSEGRIVVIDSKGPVENTLIHIEGGLRSACTYTNSANLEELRRNAVFIKVNRQLNDHLERHTIGI
jgi:GMP reductase